MRVFFTLTESSKILMHQGYFQSHSVRITLTAAFFTAGGLLLSVMLSF